MKGLVRYWLLGFVALCLIGPATAGATVVTVGSPLTTMTASGMFGPATLANFALPEAGANVTSPVSGIVIRWRINGASGGPFRLRVLAPAGPSMTYTGAGTGAPEIPSSTDLQTFTTNLPIKAGDLIGVDVPNPSDEIGLAAFMTSENFFGFWMPPLANGETRAGSFGTSAEEVLFNADVATIPSNADTLGKLTRNKHKGTATLAVSVPGPGTLSLTGKNVKPQPRVREASASSTVTAAGTVKLLVKPKGKAKKKLNKTGKAKVAVSVTYTPTGDAPGVPSTQTKTVKLVKKLG